VLRVVSIGTRKNDVRFVIGRVLPGFVTSLCPYQNEPEAPKVRSQFPKLAWHFDSFAA
jgi:hypothetical protein